MSANPSTVIKICEEFYSIPKGSIQSKSRLKTVIEARAIAIYLSEKYFIFSATELANYFFKFNHSNIFYYRDKTRNKIKSDKGLCKRILQIENILKDKLKGEIYAQNNSVAG